MRLRKSTFSGFLISYLTIMAIPVIILSFVFFGHFTDYFSTNLERTSLSALLRGQSNIDIQFAQLQSYSYRMANSIEFTTEYLDESYAQFFDVFNSLSNIKYSNEFLSDVLYLNMDLRYVYSSDSRYSFADFKTFGPSYDTLSETDTEALFHRINGTVWLPVQSIRGGERSVLTYIIPLQRRQGRLRSAAIFQISKHTMDLLVGDAKARADSSFLVADKGDEVLYSSGDTHFALDKSFWERLDVDDRNASMRTRLNGKEFLVIATTSKDTTLRYISLTPYEEIVKPLESAKTWFLLGILVATFLGSVAVLLFMRLNYSPLKALGNRARSLLKKGHTGLGAIEATHEALTRISEDNRSIHLANRRLVKDDVLLKLLCGSYVQTESFFGEAARAGVILSGPDFRIAMVKLSHERSYGDLPYADITEFVESVVSRDFGAMVVDYRENDSVIILLSGRLGEDSAVRNTLARVARSLTNRFKVRCAIGVSRAYSVMLMSYASFLEAKAATRLPNRVDAAHVVMFDELADTQVPEFNYPDDDINALYNAILLGDPGRITFATDVLLRPIQETENVIYASCLGHDIVNTAVRAVLELNCTPSSLARIYSAAFARSGLYMSEEIADTVRRVSVQVCEIVGAPDIRSESGVDDRGDISAVLDYIDHHVTEESFCTKTLSDHFGMSISNFSHFFKARTGDVVSRHINRLRMEKAKELLRTTDLTISEIVVKAGYYHISTFMRQFKQSENMTPAYYRKMYRPLTRVAAMQNQSRRPVKGE